MDDEQYLDEYWVDRTDYGDHYVEHDVKGCHAREKFWGTVLGAYNWAKEHHAVCRLRA